MRSNSRSDADGFEALKSLLDRKADKYNRPEFISDDPISVPHAFHDKQDIEIAAFWTAMLSWGLRKTIIAKARELFQLMDNAPYAFVTGHSEVERKRFTKFVHRTFQPIDTLYFLEFFQRYYREYQSLEDAFSMGNDMKTRIARFHDLFFNTDLAPQRTRKHVATTERGASCKRINMFLRWMVRRDERGVDFGLWRSIAPSELMIPLDVHVLRVALHLGLLERDKADWKAVEELTDNLRAFDRDDPVKYDFALFGMGIMEGKG